MNRKQSYARGFLKRFLYAIILSVLAYFVLTEINKQTSAWLGGFVNELRPEVIGIIITVMLIDWLIKTSEAREWESVRIRANFRVRETYIKSGTVYRYSGPYYDSLLRDLLKDDPKLISKIANEHYSIIQVFRDKYKELGYEKRWADATQMYWATLSVSLRRVIDSSERVIDLFGKYLPPSLQTALDELTNACERTEGQSRILSSLRADKTDLHVMEMHFEMVFRTHKALGEQMEKHHIV